MQVMKVIEGKIPKSKMHEFEAQYVAVRDQPRQKGMISSTLLRDNSQDGTYRIETVWQNRETLDENSRTTKTPLVIALFKSHGIEPNVRIFDVAMTIRTNQNP